MSSCQECTACYDPGIEIGFVSADVAADGFYMGFGPYKSTPENAGKSYASYTHKIQSQAQGQTSYSSFDGCGTCPDGDPHKDGTLPKRPMTGNSSSNYNATLEDKTTYTAVQESDGSVYTEMTYTWKENDTSRNSGFPGGGSCNGNDCTGPYAVSSIGTGSNNTSNSGSVSYRSVPKNTGPCLGFWDINPYKNVGENVEKTNQSTDSGYQDIPEEDRWCEPVTTSVSLSGESASFSYPAVCTGPNSIIETTTSETSVTTTYKENTEYSHSDNIPCEKTAGSVSSSYSSSYSCNATESASVEDEYDVYERSLNFAVTASSIYMQSALAGELLCGAYYPRYGGISDIIGSVLTHINSSLSNEEVDHYKTYDIYDGWEYPARIQYQNKKCYVQVAKDVFDRIESLSVKLYFYVALTDINPCNGGEEGEDYVSVKEMTISCSAQSSWKTTEDHYYFLGSTITSDDAMPSGETHYKDTSVCYVVETINFKA